MHTATGICKEVLTSLSHVWSLNTWELPLKSPKHLMFFFLFNLFLRVITHSSTPIWYFLIPFIWKALSLAWQMDGSGFDDPIKIKNRGHGSLSLPVENCREGSIKSKMSTWYYFLVIVFQQYHLRLIDVFCCLPKFNLPWSIVPNFLFRSLYKFCMFTWKWFSWDLSVRFQLASEDRILLHISLIFKSNLLLPLKFECINFSPVVVALCTGVNWLFVCLFNWTLSQNYHKNSVLNVLCQVFDDWKTGVKKSLKKVIKC